MLHGETWIKETLITMGEIIGKSPLTVTNSSIVSNFRVNDSLNYANSAENLVANSGLSIDTRRDPLYVVIPVTIIYASIFFTGTIGNISTCIVIARNKSMHTATNYYLFNLALSDLLLLVSGLPAEIYMVWCKYPYIFGESFCILRGLAAETSTNASVLTITAFTIERYIAICHPFLSQTMSKLSRAVKIILVVWLIALCFAIPQALQFGVIQYEFNPNVVMCTMKRILLRHSFELSTFLFFVVPMCLITVLYVLIGLKLRRSNLTKRHRSNEAEITRNCRHDPARSSRRVLKMLVAVVIAFFICWAPFHVQRLVAIYGTNTEDHITSNSKGMEFLYLLLTYISGVLYYVSTTINPILYNIMSKKFRAVFMETLSQNCGFHGPARKKRRSYLNALQSQQQRLTTNDGSDLRNFETITTPPTSDMMNSVSIPVGSCRNTMATFQADNFLSGSETDRPTSAEASDAEPTSGLNEDQTVEKDADARSRYTIIMKSQENQANTNEPTEEENMMTESSTENNARSLSKWSENERVCERNGKRHRHKTKEPRFWYKRSSSNFAIRNHTETRWWRLKYWRSRIMSLSFVQLRNHFSSKEQPSEDAERYRQSFLLTT